ncbi:MAG: hypothetical protein R3C12_01550 [Planctomycetaceae bacterium]
MAASLEQTVSGNVDCDGNDVAFHPAVDPGRGKGTGDNQNPADQPSLTQSVIGKF